MPSELEIPPEQPLPAVQPESEPLVQQMPLAYPEPHPAPPEQLHAQPLLGERRGSAPQPQQPQTMKVSYQQSQVAEQGFLGEASSYQGGAATVANAPVGMTSQPTSSIRELGSVSGAMKFLTEITALAHADPDSPTRHHPVKLATEAAVRDLGQKLTEEAAQDKRGVPAPSQAISPAPAVGGDGHTARGTVRSRQSSLSIARSHITPIPSPSRQGTAAVDVNKALPPVTPTQEAQRRHSATRTDAPGPARRPASRSSSVKVHKRSATQGSIDMDGRYPKMSVAEERRAAQLL